MESRAWKELSVILGFASEGITADSSLKLQGKHPTTITLQYARQEEFDPKVLKTLILKCHSPNRLQ